MPSPDKARPRARASVHEPSRLSYPGTLAMLGVACAFPIALMIFNPTLMFERGWEQYVGTAIYVWAVLALGRELARLWTNERAFEEAPALLAQVTGTALPDDLGAREQKTVRSAIDADERR